MLSLTGLLRSSVRFLDLNPGGRSVRWTLGTEADNMYSGRLLDRLLYKRWPEKLE